MSTESSEEKQTTGEPCPQPLVWRDVVESVRSESVLHQIQTSHAEISVLEIGSGVPLVVLPGTTGTPLLFSLSAWLLKNEYRCLLVDFPKWHTRPSVKDYIETVADSWAMTIEYLSPQGAHLYAPTWSGQAGLFLASQSPQLVRSLILQSSWDIRQWTLSEKLLLKSGRWMPGNLHHLPMWNQIQIQNHRRWFPPFDETRFEFLLHETSTHRIAEISHRLLASAVRPAEQSIPKTPLVVLRCEGEGRGLAQSAERLLSQYPNAKEEWMALTGQFPYLTHPHRLVKIIRQHSGSESA